MSVSQAMDMDTNQKEEEDEEAAKSIDSLLDDEDLDDEASTEDESDDGTETGEPPEDLEKTYNSLREIIKANVYSYHLYEQLLDAAHAIQDLAKIRESYELFSSVYPLAPAIWLKWLEVETNLAHSPSEIEAVHKLFRRALNDYYSPKVAFEFAKFITNNPNGDVDTIWDELLTVYALTCKDGRQFFELWRKYFETKDISHSEKCNKIVEIYKKELSIPLYDMEDSYIEFKVFCTKHEKDISVDWTEVEDIYQDAKEDLADILIYENQLTKLDSKSYQAKAELYKTYIKKAYDIIDKNILQTIFERMITDCCLNVDCWLDYINYLYERDKGKKWSIIHELRNYPVFKQSSMDVVNRALKNCPWSEKLHIQKLNIAERLNYSKDDVRTILEEALAVAFEMPEPEVAVWLEYLTYLKRQTDLNNEKEVDILRRSFELAWNSLGNRWGSSADPKCEILQFWGHIEYDLRNTEEGSRLWSIVMENSDNYIKSGLWIEYANFELKHSVDGARKIYNRAMEQPYIDDYGVLTSSWTGFERFYGTLDQLKICQNACSKLLQTINKEVTENKSKTQKTLSKGINKKRKRNSNDSEDVNKRKDAETIKTKTQSKKQKIETKEERIDHDHNIHLEVDTSKDHLTVFLSNLDYNITEEEIVSGFPELSIVKVDLVTATSGKGRGFGYILLESESDVEKALGFDLRLIKSRPVYISKVIRDKQKRAKFKYAEIMEPTKLFVKGLPYDAVKEELEEIFGECGNLKDVRIVHHKSGKSKGIAYIEFVDESSASCAVLKLDKYNLRGFEINVAISAPPPKQETESQVKLKSLLGPGYKKQILKSSNQKPRMNLIPTSVQKNILHEDAKQTENSPSTSQGKPTKTNEDFRKLLLK